MPAKRIVLCTFGSLGDLYPFLSLALEMKRRGHSPFIATTPLYRETVEAAGLGFYPVRPYMDPTDPQLLAKVVDRANGLKFLMFDLLLPSLRDSFADTQVACENADLIVIHPLTLSAYLIARKRALPWCYVALAPVSLSSTYDPPIFTGLPFAEKFANLGPVFQRVFRKTMASLFEFPYRPFRKLESELGLPHEPNTLLWAPHAPLVLGLFSPILGPPQRDWPPTAHATGFPYYDHSHETPAELLRFLDSGDPPIVFTLGSAAVAVAGDFFRNSAEAAHALGHRAVLLVGRDARNPAIGKLPPDVLAVPYAPHASVFPRASVNVHAGGIGTTGEAMRAGKPMLVIPYSHDQPDNAARLVRLGIARSVTREQYSVSVAVREITALLQNSRYSERAAQVGSQVSAESGLQTACDLLCKLL